MWVKQLTYFFHWIYSTFNSATCFHNLNAIDINGKEKKNDDFNRKKLKLQFKKWQPSELSQIGCNRGWTLIFSSYWNRRIWIQKNDVKLKISNEWNVAAKITLYREYFRYKFPDENYLYY